MFSKTTTLQFASLFLFLFALALLGPGDCKEPPPCEGTINAFSGGADGYVYRSYSTGRMTSDRLELCVNIEGAVSYYTNTDDMQAITLYDTIEDVDVIVMYYYDIREPYTTDDGAIFMTTQSAAEYSNQNDWPIPMDGEYAIGYFFMGNWFTSSPNPTHISISGELTFPTFTYVTGGPVSYDFHGELAPYTESSAQKLSLLPVSALSDLIKQVKFLAGQ